MGDYKKAWNSLKIDLKIRIREYQNAEAVTGGLEYENEIEMDAWEGVLQTMEGLEREIEEDDLDGV